MAGIGEDVPLAVPEDAGAALAEEVDAGAPLAEAADAGAPLAEDAEADPAGRSWIPRSEEGRDNCICEGANALTSPAFLPV